MHYFHSFFAPPLLTATFFVALFCTPAYADDLITVFMAAKDNDASVGAARASYLADKERLPQARAALLPQ